MPDKPPLPNTFADPYPRIPIDESEGGAFSRILRLATFAAEAWALGPDGPTKQPMTAAQATRGEVREALLYLLELGFIDIDEQRFNTVKSYPLGREPSRG